MSETNEDGRKTALTKRRDAAIEEYGEDAVYGFVEIGLTARQIAEKLGLDGDDDRAMWSVYNFLQSDPERYERAKERSVDALAAKADTYSEDPPSSTAESKWQNDRSGYWRWMAELRAGLRDKGGATVNVNLGRLHLEALKAQGSMANSPAQEEPIDAEYEVEDGEKPRDKYAGKSLGEIPGD